MRCLVRFNKGQTEENRNFLLFFRNILQFINMYVDCNSQLIIIPIPYKKKIYFIYTIIEIKDLFIGGV